MKVNVTRGHKSIGRGISLRSGRLGRIFARYRDARKSMRVSISRQSQRGLDWMNFFLADVQTGFGAFVAFYLADLGWQKDQVGLALTAGTLAGVLLGDALLVPVTEVGSMASALGWLAACVSFWLVEKRISMRVVTGLGIVVSSLLFFMKVLPIIPGHFSLAEWIALSIWLALGALLHRSPRSAPL